MKSRPTPAAQKSRDGPGHGAGQGTDGHTDRSAEQSDQAAKRQTRGRADGTGVHRLLDVDRPLGVFGEHGGGKQRDVACSVQVAKCVQPRIGSRFSVEDGD
ncbi:MAG: hypothetical protein IPO43_03785 [Rhodoferax sp.]|nr:hypothetical protein [Rhodoferax sp.]